MSARPICELCGTSSPVGSTSCSECGRPLSSGEDRDSGVIGAPVWGRIDVKVASGKCSQAIAESLKTQWEWQEQKATQQVLFPGQSRVFCAAKPSFKVFAPLWSYEELLRFVAARLSGEVTVAFTELLYEEIYEERDLWLASVRQT